MRIVCPSCAAIYELADGRLPGPTSVRCSRCAEQWVQAPNPPAVLTQAPTPVSMPVSEPVSEPVPVPIPVPAFVPGSPLEAALPEPAAARRPRPILARPLALTLAWIVSLLVLAALAVAVYEFRAEIQLAWPPSTRLFRLLAT